MKPIDDLPEDPAGAERVSDSRTSHRTRTLVLVPVLDRSRSRGPGQGARDGHARLEEATGLAEAIDLEVVRSGEVRLAEPRPPTLFGAGKVEEIAGLVAADDVGLVVVDWPLSPVQQRNLERHWKTKVLDRTGLILEIFGARARTREGRLQVELAHLNWQKSRLVRSWTHLERQRGGFGFLGGPGETQIEADRRLIQDRIVRIERELASVRRTRGLHRHSRARVPYPVAAIVGYTNAGKSTLFNRLTQADVQAEDMLFATLDPTLRALRLPRGRTGILSDTVGFISDLPTHLIAAFRATLEEVVEADLVIHVRDISHPDTEAQAEDVHEVLQSLGIDPRTRGRLVEVWNKIDLLDLERRGELENRVARLPAETRPCLVSAVTGEGADALLEAIADRLAVDDSFRRITLDAGEGAALNWLYERCDVAARRTDEATGRIALDVYVPPRRLAEFDRRFGPGKG